METRPYQSPSTHPAALEEGGTKADSLDERAAEEMMQKLRGKFQSGQTRSLSWREGQLRNVLQMLEDREEDLIGALGEDLGRGRRESLAEVLTLWKGVSHMVGSFRRFARTRKVNTPLMLQPGRSEVVPEPMGVVLVIVPWNFPFLLSLEPLVGALAAGNAVCLKPSEHSPACSQLLAKLVSLYLDAEAVQVVEGGPSTGQLLLAQRWDKIFFTGGTALGRLVMEAATRHLTPVTLELGGKNPLYIDETADLEVSARRIISGKLTNAGQVCLVPDYIMATTDVTAKLISKLQSCIDTMYSASPEHSPEFGRIVSSRHVERLQRLVAHEATNACVVAGGQSDAQAKYFSPTLLLNVPWDAPIMEQEVFGPILAIQTVSGVDEALSIINARPKPLVVTLFSSNEATRQRFVNETSSGALVTNEVILQATNQCLPFGGVGDSGMGRYKGEYSFECFSHMKAVFTKSFHPDMALRYPPSTRKNELIFKAVVRGAYFSLLLILLGLKR